MIAANGGYLAPLGDRVALALTWMWAELEAGRVVNGSMGSLVFEAADRFTISERPVDGDRALPEEWAAAMVDHRELFDELHARVCGPRDPEHEGEG